MQTTRQVLTAGGLTMPLLFNLKFPWDGYPLTAFHKKLFICALTGQNPPRHVIQNCLSPAAIKKNACCKRRLYFLDFIIPCEQSE